ncbi:MAG: DNA polymerase III subunit beta [Parcubacteria group bacterium]|nr:DNA polymerase III subunit beta [Parcubacteria group bacterium]
MKIECVKEKLNSAIIKAEKITGKNLSLPVLSCLYLEAKDNNLKIKATNLELGIEIDVPVKVINPGVVAIPAGVLNNFVSNLNDKNITLELIEKNLVVSTPQTSTFIKSIPHDDFPTIPMVSGDVSLKINPTDFAEGLKSVWYSSAVSSMKPELSSIYIHGDDDIFTFAATDSFRLAEKKVKIKNGRDFGNTLIPFKNVGEIIRILDEMKGEVVVHLGKNQISFSQNGIYLASRVIDGVFPDYGQIIAKDFKTEVVVLKQDLIHSLKVANIFSDKFNQISIQINPSLKTFQIKTKNTEVGENTNFVDAVLSGEEININFNYKYIVDCFQSINVDSVSLQFNGLGKPMVIRGVGDKSFLYLVMPMNK